MRAGRPYCLSHGGNVAAGRHAKTPQRQRRHTVARYARLPPLRRRFSPTFSFARSGQRKNGKTPSKRVVAPRYRLVAGDLATTVCWAEAPQINRRVGASFCSLGRQNLFGSPRPARFPLGEALAGGFGRRKCALSAK